MTWFDQMEEERKKRQQALQSALSNYQSRQTQTYQPDYAGTKKFLDAYNKPKKQNTVTKPTVTKTDTSKHHGILDTLMADAQKIGSGIENFAGEAAHEIGKIGSSIGNFLTQKNSDVTYDGMMAISKKTGKPATANDLKNGTSSDQLKYKFGANVAMGTGDVVKSVGDIAQWAGPKGFGGQSTVNVGKQISDFAENNMIKPLDTEDNQYSKKFSWHSMLDPEWYATTGARALPFTLSMFLPGAAGFKAGEYVGEIAANASKIGAFGKTVIKGLMAGAGAHIMTGPFEAATEAANTYNQALAQGNDHKTADSMANKVFWQNEAVLAASQIPEFAMMFSPLLKKGAEEAAQSGIKKLLKGAASTAGSTALEGGQEAVQQIIQDNALGNKHDWNSIAEQGAIGGIMGGVPTAVSHLAEGIQHRRKGPDTNPTDQNQPNEQNQQGPETNHAPNSQQNTPTGGPTLEDQQQQAQQQQRSSSVSPSVLTGSANETTS